MKHSKPRLTARERAASAFIMPAFIGLLIIRDADKLWQLVAALTIVVGMLAIGALILNWPEIKESLQKENAPGRAATRTRRTSKNCTFNIPDSARNVNPDMEAE